MNKQNLLKYFLFLKLFFIFLGTRLSWPTFINDSDTNMYNKVISSYMYGIRTILCKTVMQYCAQ